jgi:UDP-N-acetylglucosamine--N-acetylmuramyl-(pentapeptide) pyrophosphoryl-undecaprenol N-acetylglucosamine transferase
MGKGREEMSIVMTGGGTGGHLVIVQAVKEHLADQNLHYIGSTRGQDQAWFGEDPAFTSRHFLHTRGLVNQGPIGLIGSLWMLARAIVEARRLLKRHDAHVLFSVGGFSAAPAAIAAKLSGTPLVIHEQNATMGMLNRLLKPFAEVFLSAYDPDSPVTAYPVKQTFFDRARVRKHVRTVIFLGGSQGAQAINRLALAIAPELHRRGIDIIHQAGERHILSTRDCYASMGIEAEVFGFTAQIDRLMQRADMAIARAGASTLWESAANGLPALFIPYPHAAKDHQYANARHLANQQLAWVMREEAIDEAQVLEIIRGDMAQRSRRLIETTLRDGGEQIAALLRRMAHG